MRAETAVGAAAVILGLAAVVTVGAASLAAQAGKPAAPATAGQTVEKQVVIERQADGKPNIVVRQGGGQGGGIYRPAMGGRRLGIEVRDVTKDDVAALKLPGQQGVVVSSVTKESAAEKAGLKPGDVVVAYDGETVRSAQQLTRLVGETAPGRAVKLALVRDGKRMEIEATPAETPGGSVSVFVNPDEIRGDITKQLRELDERKSQQLRDLREQLNRYRLERRAPVPGDEGLRFKMEGPLAGERLQWFGEPGGPLEMLLAPGRGRLGVTVQELTPELAAYFGVKDGVLVASVAADSPAAKAGIKAGDVITTVNDKAVTSAGELIGGIGGKGGEVSIGLTRDRKPLALKATIEPVKPPARRIVLRTTPA